METMFKLYIIIGYVHRPYITVEVFEYIYCIHGFLYYFLLCIQEFIWSVYLENIHADQERNQGK